MPRTMPATTMVWHLKYQVVLDEDGKASSRIRTLPRAIFPLWERAGPQCGCLREQHEDRCWQVGLLAVHIYHWAYGTCASPVNGAGVTRMMASLAEQRAGEVLDFDLFDLKQPMMLIIADNLLQLLKVLPAI